MTLTRETITLAIDAYLDAVLRSDVEAIVDAYAQGASVEDPIGSEPKRGDAIREFYSRPRQVRYLQRLGVIAIAGSYAGYTFHLELERTDGIIHVFVHETLRFDDSGKILSMVAVPDFSIRDMLPGAFLEVATA